MLFSTSWRAFGLHCGLSSLRSQLVLSCIAIFGIHRKVLRDPQGVADLPAMGVRLLRIINAPIPLVDADGWLTPMACRLYYNA